MDNFSLRGVKFFIRNTFKIKITLNGTVQTLLRNIEVTKVVQNMYIKKSNSQKIMPFNKRTTGRFHRNYTKISYIIIIYVGNSHKIYILSINLTWQNISQT